MKNQTRKYFKYAIGEILLVVIGILIALQINNWNETNKEKAIEIDLLKGIRDDILRDTIDINFNIRGLQTLVRRDSILLEHLTSKKPYETDIAYLMLMSQNNFTLTLHSSHFEEIRLRGWSTISNTELKEAISRLYEFDYAMLQNQLNRNDNAYEIQFYNSVSKYMEFYDGDYAINSEDYKKLLSDKNLFFQMKTSISLKTGTLDRHKDILNKALAVKDSIDLELKKITND